MARDVSSWGQDKNIAGRLGVPQAYLQQMALAPDVLEMCLGKARVEDVSGNEKRGMMWLLHASDVKGVISSTSDPGTCGARPAV